MKIRQGFVSNSSSSSFVINKECLSPKQIKQIYKHQTSGLDFALTDYWSITEDEYRLYGSTIMDNFDMAEFLEIIGVNSKDIQWEHF